MISRLFLLSLIVSSLSWMGCQPTTEATGEVKIVGDTLVNDVVTHPAWAHDASIYEINIRQYSPEGTINQVTRDLDRIEELGVEILWLMPVSPIGEVNRKGGLGSYYSISDYTAVNPEFGTMNDLVRFVREAHKRDMKVIIDWVANHSAFDHVWSQDHLDWYVLDTAGLQQPPVPDWSDVADLNYESDSMRLQMIANMKFWVKEADIDGFRCDVAMMVPTDFWEEARAELDKIKPMFMLAEAEQEDHHNKAFNMSYGWHFHHVTNAVAKGEMNSDSIDSYMQQEMERFPLDAYRMMFTTNHDENSWNGTVFERYGDAHKTYATLAFTIHGMPLIYSGQERGLDKRLAFFEKDTIDWKDKDLEVFYQTLLRAKKENKALHNGSAGGTYERIMTAERESIFAYKREKDGNEVVVVLNFSDQEQPLSLVSPPSGSFHNIFDDTALAIYTDGEVKLEPYGYYVFTNR